MHKLIDRYLTFLRRSMYTHKHDIVQPYHKIVDLCLKVVSLAFAFVGSYYLIVAPLCFVDSVYDIDQGKLCSAILAERGIQPFITSEITIFQTFLMYWLTGAGYLLVTIFMALVLVVRHLNETLPDHIYLRCFASEEEKSKRLPLREHSI